MSQPILLTVREVAELCRLSEAGVRKLARRGELPSVRVGSSLRFHRSAIENLVGPITLDVMKG